MAHTQILDIMDGPNRKELWLQTPKIDEWVASKDITQMPVEFRIGSETSSSSYLLYLDEITTVENSQSAILFSGQTIDPISGERKLVEGQYDYVEHKGYAKIRSAER